MVISYSVWKYILAVGLAFILFGVWRMIQSGEVSDLAGVVALLIGGPLTLTGITLGLIARSRDGQ